MICIAYLAILSIFNYEDNWGARYVVTNNIENSSLHEEMYCIVRDGKIYQLFISTMNSSYSGEVEELFDYFNIGKFTMLIYKEHIDSIYFISSLYTNVSRTCIRRFDTLELLSDKSLGDKLSIIDVDTHNFIKSAAIIKNYDTIIRMQFEASIPNIHFTGLFFPEIEYLPSTIIDSAGTTWQLIEIFYDQNRIDKLFMYLDDPTIEVIPGDQIDLENRIRYGRLPRDSLYNKN